jgi:hypothetical protein
MSLSHEAMRKQLLISGFRLSGRTTKVTEYSKRDFTVYTNDAVKNQHLL